MVIPTLSSYEAQEDFPLYALQFNGLTKNTRTVIRIDILIENDIACGCSCTVVPIGRQCQCPVVPTPRKTHLSSSMKRYHQAEGFNPTNPDRDSTRELGRDEFTVALFVDDYYVNGNYYTFPVKFVPFVSETLCNILSCTDYTGCYTGTAEGKIGNTYKDRGCEFVAVSCDDGDDKTYDRCVPPSYPYGEDEPKIPICIHSGWDDIQDSYCYYGDGFHCDLPCISDDDCDGGACFESSECSVDVSFLQEEILESANSTTKHQSGSLKPLQLFGIIGGCIVLVVTVVFVLVKKFYLERSINEDTIASLRVPLN